LGISSLLMLVLLSADILLEGFWMDKKYTIYEGMTFGSVLAVVISWSLYKSIFWAILHGFFSWFYVVYYWLVLCD
jgi:hypothetical protein